MILIDVLILIAGQEDNYFYPKVLKLDLERYPDRRKSMHECTVNYIDPFSVKGSDNISYLSDYTLQVGRADIKSKIGDM